MKKLYLIGLIFLFLISHSFSQQFTNIFQDVNESSITQSEKHFLDQIKRNEEFKKLKVVKLLKTFFVNSEKISLSLFNDLPYNFVIEKIQKLDSLSVSVYGKDNSNFISFVIRDSKLSGTVQIDKTQYSIIPLGDGLHTIIEIDYSKLPPEAPPIEIKGEGGLQKDNSIETASTIADILVAYTPAAKNAVSDIVGLIQNAVNSANVSFPGDDIDLEYNLVLAIELNYSEGTKTMSQILDDFRTNTTIQNLRNEYSADLCFLVTNRSDISGIGYLLEYPSGLSGHAYAIANYNRVRDTYTLAHETGHNLGAKHDTLADNSPGYNHGFRYTSGQWCTIMSYYTTETRQNFWSNPNKTFQGVIRGNATYADNARKLSETKATVSLFRSPQLSGTLSKNQTLSGRSFTLTGNLTVPSGKTLKIEPTATLELNGYYVKSTGGTIIQQSGATVSGLNAYLKTGGTLKGLFPTIQLAINNASSSQTVELLSKTYSGSTSFSGKSNITLIGQGTGNTILNGSISVTNSSYISISNIRLNNTLTINSSSYTSIYSSNLQSSTMVNDYSGTQTNLGFSSGTYATANFAYNSYGGSGDIYYTEITNKDVAVYIVNNASYNVGDQDYFCNNLLDIYAASGGYAYAISNTYSYSGAVQGNVFVTGINYVCNGFAKNSESLEGNSTKKFENADEKYLWLLRMISEDKREGNFDLSNYIGYYNELITEYKDLLNVSTEKDAVKNSLLKLSHLYKAINRMDEFISFVNSLINTEQVIFFKPYFERHLIWNSISNGDYNNSIEVADKIISATDDDDLICEMMYEKGLIYKYFVKDITVANKMFNNLVEKYNDHLLSKYALTELNTEQENIYSENKIDQAEGYSITSYPNPFNPVTTINYTLPLDEKVLIKVYDVLGREITTLVNEEKQAGAYSVLFDASNFASGIYFYRIEAGKFSQAKKLILAK